MRFLLNALVSICGVAASLGLLELGFRVISVSEKAQTWTDRPAAYYKPSSASSLQDYTYPDEKEAGVFRIAVIGDSFTFAPYMQFDDAFPKRLERMLNLSENTPVEVINYGVPGFSTGHEVGALKKALTQGADFVLLQITLNDPQIKPYQPTGLRGGHQFGEFESKHWVTEYSKLANFIATRLHNTNTHSRYVDYYFDLFSKKKNWEYFSNSLKRLRRVARKAGIPMVAVTFPLFGIPLDKDYPFHPIHQKVQNLLSDLEIENLDLYNAFSGIPLERIQVIPGADFHPNEIGHRIAAEAIYSWLAERSLIPQDTHIEDLFKTRTDIRVMDKNRLSPLASNAPFSG